MTGRVLYSLRCQPVIRELFIFFLHYLSQRTIKLRFPFIAKATLITQHDDGMCTEIRILHHLTKNMCYVVRCVIFKQLLAQEQELVFTTCNWHPDQNTHKQTRAPATAGLFLSLCSHWPADNNWAHISVQIWQRCVSRASAMTQIHASMRHMHGIITRSIYLPFNTSFSVSVLCVMWPAGRTVNYSAPYT